MKKSAKFFVTLASLATASLMFAGIAEAKSAKWYCYAPDPSTPWIQTCYSSTNRP